MENNIYTTYALDTDTTFIMEDSYRDGELKETRIMGFYYGEPNDEDTERYYGHLKARF